MTSGTLSLPWLPSELKFPRLAAGKLAFNIGEVFQLAGG
jgi:hypothetical protein